MPGYRGTRKGSRSSGSSAAGALIAAYLNPFSKAISVPKIPDGGATLSTGFRQQSKTDYTLKDPDDVVFIAAGRDGCMYMEPAVSDMSVAPWTALKDYTIKTTGGVTPYSSKIPTTEINSWRAVGCAVRFTVYSDVGNNSGWFEAVRLGSGDGINYSTANMLENPSYMTGKIRDLGKYLFQLKPIGSNHNFITKVETETQFDSSWDTIMIIFHGGIKTSMVAHAICNQEVVFDETSSFQRFMTPAVQASGQLASARKKLMGHVHAARMISY